MGYTTRDVHNLLGLSVRQAQEYGRSGILDPRRGPGDRYLFGFQDLVLLRTAKALLDADVGQRRVLRVLRSVKRQLPTDRPLSEVRIAAEGEDVVVYDQGRAWEPESEQLRFVFDVADLAAVVEPMAQRAVRETAARSASAGEWLELGAELETHAPAQARAAYEKALELDPSLTDALINLGRLYQLDGEIETAVRLYGRALEAGGGDHPTAAFNLGIACEDLAKDDEAAAAYELALSADPSFADAHYNLSRVRERMGDRVSALRHLKAYRELAHLST
jgi:tetratricopeptide (TPR) repeat protein